MQRIVERKLEESKETKEEEGIGIDTNRLATISEDKLNKELICLICTNILNNPRECSECQTNFCKYCIETWNKTNKTCPNRCKKLTLRKTHKMVTNLLNELIVKCKHTKTGCKTAIKYELLKKHECSCAFKESFCQNKHKGCKYRGVLKTIPEHMKECMYEIRECESGCGARVERKDMKTHSCIKYLRERLKEKHQKEEDNEKRIQQMQMELVQLREELVKVKEKVGLQDNPLRAAHAPVPGIGFAHNYWSCRNCGLKHEKNAFQFMAKCANCKSMNFIK